MTEDDRPENGQDDRDVITEVPLEGVLDLHMFQPADVLDVVQEYLRSCRERGILEIRIIHGKGKGVQRKAVRDLLAGLSMVRSFRDAEGHAGGWGATVLELFPPDGGGLP